jgi:hypothetical protein
MARPYDRSVRPETRIVPPIAVPSDEPRLDTLRDRPDISPWRSSGKLDCTMLTEGVSITPTPMPIRKSPGAKAYTLGEPFTSASRTPMPASVVMNPATISVRCGCRLASRSAASDENRIPPVAAVKITPVSMAL